MDFPVHRKWRGQGTSTKLCALWIPVRNDAAKVWGMRRIVVQDNQKRIRAVQKAPLLAAVINFDGAVCEAWTDGLRNGCKDDWVVVPIPFIQRKCWAAALSFQSMVSFDVLHQSTFTLFDCWLWST
jgi:hypothetical protein